MRFVRVYTGSDGEPHFELRAFEFDDAGGLTVVEETYGVAFSERPDGGFFDFHPAPRRQYVPYLTASVDLGVGAVLEEARGRRPNVIFYVHAAEQRMTDDGYPIADDPESLFEELEAAVV